MPSRILRVATAGAGYFSQFHHDGWKRIPAVDLVAVADQRAPAAQSTAERFDVPLWFSNVEAMLDSTKPDVLDIITPPATHADLVSLAAERGIDVICQKPL